MSNYQSRLDKIKEIALLEDGWYDGSGEKIPSKVIEQAYSLVAYLHLNSLPLPRIYPTEERSMSFEWGPGVTSVALEIMDDGSLELATFDQTGDDNYSFEPTHDVNLTMAHLKNSLITAGVASQTLAARHMRHYNHCNCLDNASECCDRSCECHDTEKHTETQEGSSEK